MAIGRSFFEQLAPTRSVTLGWSSIALHWLSAQPGPVAGIWPHLATPAQQNTWQAAAAADWVQFLSARGAELPHFVSGDRGGDTHGSLQMTVQLRTGTAAETRPG